MCGRVIDDPGSIPDQSCAWWLDRLTSGWINYQFIRTSGETDVGLYEVYWYTGWRFNVYGSVHRKYILIYIQQDETLHSLTLVNFQLDAQNSYLFTYNTFIKILYTFRALPCLSSGGLRRNCIYATSGIFTVCKWLSCAPVKKVLS